MKQCFFFIYRMKAGASIRWDRPTGGLVMSAKSIFGNVAVADLALAEEIASIRFHCGPGEHLLIAEVLDEPDKLRAKRLHRRYEREMSEFLELMNWGEEPCNDASWS